MKKLCIYLFLVLFSLQTPSWADDIRDLQIEGMSIGDSLLDYYSEEQIKNATTYKYKNNKFTFGVILIYFIVCNFCLTHIFQQTIPDAQPLNLKVSDIIRPGWSL